MQRELGSPQRWARQCGCVLPGWVSPVSSCDDRAPRLGHYIRRQRIGAGQYAEVERLFVQRLAPLAAAVLRRYFGCDLERHVHLYNEQWIAKPSGGGSLETAFNIHRDRDYDAADKVCERPGSVALWMPLLQAVSRHNGAMCLVPKHAEPQFLQFIEAHGGSAMQPDALANATLATALLTAPDAPVAASGAQLLTLQPGDVVVFPDDRWHWSLPNRCARSGVDYLDPFSSRTAWMVQFSAAPVCSRRRQGAAAALAIPVSLGDAHGALASSRVRRRNTTCIRRHSRIGTAGNPAYTAPPSTLRVSTLLAATSTLSPTSI
ncbi:hypothetical protein CDCA_CDCA05G1688 [Cyanidium caldarium]|uniref:JmjC domain-containing protein n=1 Tax=Cyanidium caldarium TaxID=2771 RepID=A0AAV9ITQ6_CYACA|nr:hypothetical protein CDCA_CDCA05G1688 [Cyanidium caldarium]